MRKTNRFVKLIFASFVFILLTACQSTRQEKYHSSMKDGDETTILTVKNNEILKTEFWKELPDIDASDSLSFHSAKDSLLDRKSVV